MNQPVENEIKLRMPSPEAAREAMRKLGARLVRPRQFEDNLLLDDARSSLGRGGRILRLRRTEGGDRLTLKGRRRDVEGVKTRMEIEAPIGEPEALQAILQELGFRPVFRYQKYRETYRWEGVEIVVDETPVGTFVEIEGEVQAIHRAAVALGYGPDDYIRESYGALFLASGGQGDMVFE